MCIFGGSPSVAPPPPLPPAPPAPLPPTPPVDPPQAVKTVDPQVRRAKKERGKKLGSNYQDGTGGLRIKLNPKLNTGMGQNKPGGLN